MAQFAAHERDILAFFEAGNLDKDGHTYLAFHLRRFVVLLERVDACAARRPHDAPVRRILDIGPGPLTAFLRGRHPEVTIDSLGFADARYPCRPRDTHIAFDLLRSVDPSAWPNPEPYDIVLMTEVLEHLAVDPLCVLACVRPLVAARGRLVLQTPNACSLPKRLRMVRGHNPFEMIRPPGAGAGHVREYTRREMHAIFARSGFRVVAEHVENYFRRNTWSDRCFRLVGGLLPATWRNGMTFVAARAEAGAPH